ncbi:MAG: type II toxin-antitoxin system VapC family toxin [Candidatus Methanomethylicia archaeon]
MKFFSREEGWNRVREVLLEGVVTLDLGIKEVANALGKKVLKDEISYDIAQTILKDLVEERAIPIIDQERFLTQAFTLAVNDNITIYDAIFIVIAKELKTELVTSDKRQMDIAMKNGVKVVFIE